MLRVFVPLRVALHPKGSTDELDPEVFRVPAMQETRGSIPGPGRSPGEGHGNPLQDPTLTSRHLLD